MGIFRRATLSAAALVALLTMFPSPALAAAGAATGPSAAPSVELLIALRAKIPLNPIGLAADPYIAYRSGPPRLPAAGTVCGVRFAADQVHYELATFASKAAAVGGGYAVTHYGACGTCSTLQDLAVYLEKPDLTTPVRRCGISMEEAAVLACLKALGFSPPCAWTWLYNVQNTRHQCFSVCARSWVEGEESTHQGHLNACLQCDEDRSGPVFKVTAGRTRRNSGIRSSIPRLDDEIAPVVHDYIPGAPR
jgi:hypothetical protein